MGTLVPGDFSLANLKNTAERRVVEALRDGLDDGWVIVPDVGIVDKTRDRQCDIVLLHADQGIANIEVKGHRMRIAGGQWCGPDAPLNPQPIDQTRDNSYAIRTLLREGSRLLKDVRVEYAIAIPNTIEVKGDLPPEVKPCQVLTAPMLEDTAAAVDELMALRWRDPIGHERVQEAVRILRPDVDFTWDANAQLAAARARLDEISGQQIKALETLDLNRRVVAVGAAGTGKTRLAMAWARRAALRDERVLLTCFNEPLAETLRARMPSYEDLHIAPFLRFVLNLEGLPPLEVPEEADAAWWDYRPVGHAIRHWNEVKVRFDTIVVDEAQDFSPAWIGLLDGLLDPDGPRRMLLAADLSQELYPRGFRLPEPDDGWTTCHLTTNCRNTRGIGSLLRRHLAGAAAPGTSPEGTGVTWVPAETVDAAVKATGDVVERLTETDGRSTDDVLVLTCTGALRDQLAEECGLVRWEQRGRGQVVCENVHRLKGLEADTVVLVVDPDHVADDLLYVGIGRAVSELILIAPGRAAQRLGLPPPRHC